MKRCRKSASGAWPSARILRASSITIASAVAGCVASVSDDARSSGGNR